MDALKKALIALRNDEDGASFLEYTVLLAIILTVSIALLLAVGTWAGGVWSALCTALDNGAAAFMTCSA